MKTTVFFGAILLCVLSFFTFSKIKYSNVKQKALMTIAKKGYIEKKYSLKQEDQKFIHLLNDLYHKRYTHITEFLDNLSWDKKSSLRENYLTLAIVNSFLNQDSTRLDHYIQQIGSKYPKNLTLFFKGLHSYTKEEMQEAIYYWESMNEFEFDGYSDLQWLAYYFNPQWLHLSLGKCYVIDQHYDKARKILDLKYFSSTPALKEDVLLLLMQADLEEMQSIVLNQRESIYHSLAQFTSEICSTKLDDLILRELKHMIVQKMHPKWTLYFIEYLHKHKQVAYLQDLAHVMLESPFETAMFWAKVFSSTYGSTFFTQTLALLDKKMRIACDTQSYHSYGKYSEIFFTLCNEREDSLEREGFILYTHILQNILKDTNDLTQTQKLVSNWTQFHSNVQRKEELANELLNQAMFYWKKSGGEAKGLQLIHLGLSLTSNKETYLKNTSIFLISLYAYCEKSNTIDRLCMIFDACVSLNINLRTYISEESLANYLVDAKHYFNNFQYDKTKFHAAWILKIYPENQNALRLYGLSCYHLGQYQWAMTALEKIRTPDDLVVQALLLTKNFIFEESKSHLVQTEYMEKFED